MDEERIDSLEKLSEMLSYTFSDITLLDTSLTHSSYANENPDLAWQDNERLEFLGDAVLQLCISHMLIKRFSDYAEGQLSKVRAAMVNEQPLAGLAREYRIGEFMLLGRGEENSGGRDKDSILGDAVEAIIGAIYLDGGYESTLRFIRATFQSLVDEWIESPIYLDYKSLLQEASQGRFRLVPQYRITGASGPDHDKTFEIEASIGDIVSTTGIGKNKKEAEQNAARKALQKLEEI
ncbi:MAG: ribonuclease III [Thermodesulfobacteriota bacterium]|nr:ribonuclease III [Thermodesulfobacteriota bacterium]